MRIVDILSQDTAGLLWGYLSIPDNFYELPLKVCHKAYPLSHLSTLDSLNRYLPVAVLALSLPLCIALRIVDADKLV